MGVSRRAPLRLRTGRYRWEAGPGWRFGVSNGMRGVEGYRTPIGAWLGLRRWVREPEQPSNGVDLSGPGSGDGRDRDDR